MNKVLKSFILPLALCLGSTLLISQSALGHGGGKYYRYVYTDGCCNKHVVTYKKWSNRVRHCYTDCNGCVKYYYTKQCGSCPVKRVTYYN